MVNKVIAFDLGLSFGYCAGKNLHGSHRVNDSVRMLDFYNKVLDLLVLKRKGSPYQAIIFEDAKFQKGNAIYNFNAQKGILQLLAESLKIDLIPVSPMTVKKVFAGSGAASKEDMLYTASKYTGEEIKNHNEADAIGVYYTALNLK